LVPVPAAAVRFAEIALSAIDPNPRQPRQQFDPDALTELVASIRVVGVLQPVVVRPSPDADDRFQLVMGERRWRAAREAGLSSLPAVIRTTEDTQLLRHAVLENVHRAALNPLEEAAAYRALIDDLGCTHEDLAAHLGRSRSYVTGMLSLLRLPAQVQRRVAAGVLSAGHARALVSVQDPSAAERLAARIVAEGLSVRATEELIAVGNLPGWEEDLPKRTRVRRRSGPDADLDSITNELAERLDTRVRVQAARSRGRIVIEFGDRGDLARIAELLRSRPDSRP